MRSDADSRRERVWLSRLRWRLRGALQAPAFVVLTLLEAVLLNRLPVAGEDGLDPVGGVLLAGFANLAIIAIAAPVLAALRMRRRAGSRVPVVVARDRAATVLMVALAALLLAGGLLHRSTVTDARDDYDRGLAAARTWIVNQAPAYHAMIGRESVWKAGEDFYRTCVPRGRPDRSLCLYVDTSNAVPTVRYDSDQQSNARIAGPDNPGRQGS